MEDELKHILIEDFEIQSGFKIKKIELTYQIFGMPIGSSPVILVNHALTGSSLVSGKNGWWRDIVGDNKPVDTKKFTVICFNIPGNGFNKNGFDYGLNINLGDVALLFIKALEKLKISKLFAITGGSIGGCLTWEMLAIKNDIADKIIPIAADWKANDWLIANTYLQDRILENSRDPVADARIHAMTFYRTPKSLNERFKRTIKGMQFRSMVNRYVSFAINKETEFSPLLSKSVVRRALKSAITKPIELFAAVNRAIPGLTMSDGESLIRTVSFIFQGELYKSFNSIGRFTINTLTSLGTFDLASRVGMEKNEGQKFLPHFCPGAKMTAQINFVSRKRPETS